jgi:hypothetical protein
MDDFWIYCFWIMSLCLAIVLSIVITAVNMDRSWEQSGVHGVGTYVETSNGTEFQWNKND